MPTYTRTQLRNGVSAAANLTAATYNFSLVNNTGNIYFSIEGKNGELPFTKATINTTVNCSFVTGYINPRLDVKGDSTATFNLVVTSTINASNIKFRATNTLVENQANPVTGSIFGIEASY